MPGKEKKKKGKKIKNNEWVCFRWQIPFIYASNPQHPLTHKK